MGDIIVEVAIQPARPRPWEPVLVEVRGADGEPLGADVEVWIDRVPGGRRWLQLPPGRTGVTVTARRGDRIERQEAAVPVGGRQLLHRNANGDQQPAVLAVHSAPERPYRVELELSPWNVRVRTPDKTRTVSARELRRIAAASRQRTVDDAVRPLPKAQATVLASILAAAAPALRRRYEWDFGDGTTAVTPGLRVEHDYTATVDHRLRAPSYDVRCRVTGEGMRPLEVVRTLVIDSWYARCRARGHIVCPVDGAALTTSFLGTVQGRFVVHNPEDQPVTFDRIAVVPLVPERAVAPSARPGRGGGRRSAPSVRDARPLLPRDGLAVLSVADDGRPAFRPLEQAVVAAGRATVAALIHPTLDELPAEAFGYSVLLAGAAADGTPARATAVFDLPLSDRVPPALVLPVEHRDTWPWDDVRRRTVAAGTRLSSNPTVTLQPVGDDDVRVDRSIGLVTVALASEGGRVLTAVEALAIDDLLDEVMAPLTTTTTRKGRGAFGPEGPPVAGGPCNPENISSTDAAAADAASLACQLTGQEERRVSGRFVNARKGDIVLSPGAGSPMALLYQHMDPPQAHSHAGFMTRNYDEIVHCYVSGDWLVEQQKNRLIDDGEIAIDAVRFGWPGAVAQHVENAVDGEEFTDPNGDEFEISAIVPTSVGLEFGDDFRVTPPLVLKPDPVLETKAVRARLRAAADAARAGAGEVRPDGTTRQSRDHFSFFHFSDGDFAEPAPGSGKWPAGTLPSACSTFIRRMLAEAGVVFERAQNDPAILEADDLEVESDGPVTPLGGAAVVREGGVDGLYEYSADERLAAGEALQAHLLHLASESVPVIGEVIADIAEPFTNILLNIIASNTASDSEAWKSTGAAQTVSPDDMLFWDGVADGGSYGVFEPLIYRPARTEWVDVHAWTPYEKTSTVTGLVTHGKDPFPGATVTGLPDDGRPLMPTGSSRSRASVTVTTPSRRRASKTDGCSPPRSCSL